MTVKKIYTFLEETEIDMTPCETTHRKCACAAVIKNPYAGKYSEDLEELMQAGEKLGYLLTEKCMAALGVDKTGVQSYGKAVIVGEDGELEHAAAVMHPRMGKPVRDTVEGVSIMPSAKKRGGMGTAIDVPLHHKKAMKIRNNYDAMEVRIPDAPGRDELVVVIALTDSGRPHPRVGGLKYEDAKGEDGLT
ncbi:MAG: amino acid synthesis family protein [Oscillospiraceae bacterium]|nr:amino acid synthesis family protein [Oscillospiraceae bacterium]